MMKIYLILLRGINVGGKNKIPMSSLKECLEKEGYQNVTTFIASGNVVLQSGKDAKQVKANIEKILPQYFTLDSELIKVLVLTYQELKAVIDNKPKGFGEEPKKYYTDVIFLIDIDVTQAMTVFNPKEGVDTIWPGNNVIYSQRLGALRTKSRLGKIIGTKEYKSMTIRTWNTTIKLLEIVRSIDTNQ